jgi:hypothetical protein
MRFANALTALIVACLTSTAAADVIDYSLAKILLHEQTANNTAPTVLEGAELFGQIALNNGTDFTSVSLGGAVGSPIPFSTTNAFFDDWEFFQDFPSQAQLDAAFPNQTYTFDASGSPGLGTFSENVTLSGVYPGIPFYTGTVFSDAQGFDASAPFTFTWNAVSGNSFFLTIEEVDGPEVFFVDGFGSSDTSAIIPGGTLTAGTDYEAYLAFANVTADQRDSFPQGEGLSGLARETYFEFTPGTGTPIVPEPSTLILFGTGMIGLGGFTFLRRKRN